MDLAERINLRLADPAMKLTQAGLARACGVTRPSVNAWVSGKAKSIDGRYLTTAASYLGVDPHWLATGHGGMTPQTAQQPAVSEVTLDKELLAALGITRLSKEALLLAKHFDMLKNEKDRSVVYIDSLNLIMKTLSDSLMQEAPPSGSESNPLQYRSAPVEKLPA